MTVGSLSVTHPEMKRILYGALRTRIGFGVYNYTVINYDNYDRIAEASLQFSLRTKKHLTPNLPTHRPLPIVPFCGLYLDSYKVLPKKELLRGLWVDPKPGPLLDTHLHFC